MRVEYLRFSFEFSGTAVFSGENSGAHGLSCGEVLLLVISGDVSGLGLVVAAGFLPLDTLVAGSCPSFSTAGFRFCQCWTSSRGAPLAYEPTLISTQDVSSLLVMGNGPSNEWPSGVVFPRLT